MTKKRVDPVEALHAIVRPSSRRKSWFDDAPQGVKDDMEQIIKAWNNGDAHLRGLGLLAIAKWIRSEYKIVQSASTIRGTLHSMVKDGKKEDG